MESILSTNLASKSIVKLPTAATLQTKNGATASVTSGSSAKAGTLSPSSIVSAGKPQPDLGLYAPAKVSAPGQTAKADALDTSAGGVVAGKDRIVVDIEASDSGYNNRIFYSTDNFKTKQYLGVDNQTGSVDLGTFKPGTTIQFGIDNGQGDFFKTGGASANADNVDHTQVSKLADGSVRVGFEDLRGGGDRDFNDAIVRVRSVPAVTAPVSAPAPNAPGAPAAPAAAAATMPAAKPLALPVTAKPVAPEFKPAATPTAAKPLTPDVKPLATPVAANPTNLAARPPITSVPSNTAAPAVKAPAATVTANPATPAVKPSATPVAASTTTPAASGAAATGNGNRSGLADGTNPGQGAGTIKSPNQGTLNPGGLK